jgi:hypothetical protein
LLTQENISPFNNLPGNIGIQFKSEKSQHSYIISEGEIREITRPFSAPPEARINTRLNTINLDLPVSPDFSYCIPYLQSPDKSRVVASILYKYSNLYNPTNFAIIEINNASVTFIKDPYESRFIDSIAWSHDSQYFAVLRHESKITFGLLSLLSSISGHPIRKRDYFLSIYRKTGESLINIEIAENYIGTSGEIIWIAGDNPG